jgi:hypothetical protein
VEAVTIMDVPVPDELGHPGGHIESWHHREGQGFVAHSYEETPELEFPASIAVYDRMRHTETQIGAVLRAINLPILANRHFLNTEDVDPKVARFIETELGMHEDQQGRARRRRQGIVLSEHLREALLSLPLGFMPFEQVYEIGPPSAEQAGQGLPEQVAHLRKLAPRLPRTISEIRVQRDGGLAGILQSGVGWDTTGHGSGVQIIGGVGGPNPNSADEVFIPADRLVMYSFEKEGADWTGNSLLRTAYKNWLLKDHLIRIDAQAGERNGMGVPVVFYTDQGTRSEALEIAQGFRAGAYAGAAIPDGKYKLELVAPSGTIKDLIPSVKYHDEAMGRSALAMFLNLGHDNGARALGDTFVDYFVMSLRSVDDWLCGIVTEQIIRDLVELNFGPDEAYPVLEGEKISAESTPTSKALKELSDAGLLTPDPELEAEIRRRHSLPKMPAIVVAEGEGSGQSDDPADLAPDAIDPGDLDPDAGVDPLLARAEQLAARLTQLRQRGR